MTQRWHIELSGKKNGYAELVGEDKRKLKELCFVLDKFSISDSAYQEMTQQCVQLPRKHAIDQLRSELLQDINIERVPGNIQGAYVSLLDEIKRHIKQNDSQVTDTIKVKIAGDGSRVSRVSNFIVLSMSFLNENATLSTTNLKNAGYTQM